MVLKLCNALKLPEKLFKRQILGTSPREPASVRLKEVQESARVINTLSDSAAGVHQATFQRARFRKCCHKIQ